MSYTNEASLLETLERIATALEAQNTIQLELAKSQTEPITISADGIRGARRELLLIYAIDLGVTSWAENEEIDLSLMGNPWLRKRCLQAIAGEELTTGVRGES